MRPHQVSLPGTYNYTVTDANGCSASASAIINAAPSQLTLSATPANPSCFGQTGSVARIANGGTPSYAYNGTATTNLSAGTYNYTVTDANGCSASALATITVPSAVSGATSTTVASCSVANGTATVTAVGGTPGYSYLWSPGGQTTFTATGLVGGNYSGGNYRFT